MPRHVAVRKIMDCELDSGRPASLSQPEPNISHMAMFTWLIKRMHEKSILRRGFLFCRFGGEQIVISSWGEGRCKGVQHYACCAHREPTMFC